MESHNNCECETCRLKRQGLSEEAALAARNEMEKRWMVEKGWFIHYIPAHLNNNPHGLANIHTHGLQVSAKHLDFQIVLDISDKEAGWLLTWLVDAVKQGKKFEPDTVYRGMLQDEIPLKFIKTTESGGHEVLRVLIPDKKGRLPEEPGCCEPYKNQLLPVE